MVKTELCLILTTLLAIFAFLPNTFAQDSPQWHLSEGAKACLGKGRIKRIRRQHL